MTDPQDPLGPHWEALAKANPQDVARRSLADIDPGGGGYRMEFLRREYLVDPATRTVRPADPEDTGRVNFEVRMVLLVYLAYAKEIPLAKKWVTEKRLPTGELFFRGLHALPTPRLAQHFGDRPEALAEAVKALGGKEVMGSADLTLELTPLPRVPVRLLLWTRDDEFDAHATILFDAFIEHQLALDAIGSMVSRLVKCLCRAVV